MFKGVGGVNTINNQAQLASLGTAAVVKPNEDTIYSRVIVDMSQGDLELTVPEITDRFSIYPFCDTYVLCIHPSPTVTDEKSFGNNFANISPVNASKPGVYLVRRADHALVKPGLRLTVPKTYSKHQGIVKCPTTYVTS